MRPSLLHTLLSSLLVCLLILPCAPATGQIAVGTLSVDVAHSRPGLSVRLTESSTGSVLGEVTLKTDTTVTFRDIPFAAYTVCVLDSGAVVGARNVPVNSAVAVHVRLVAIPEFELHEITVEGAGTAIPGYTSRSFYATQGIQALPSISGPKRIESVLLSTPGVVPDEDGRMHVRGEDAQLQFVVDGIPITGNLTRVYSSLFNSDIIQSADLMTGGLSARYGVATSGILAITTKSGFAAPFFVHATGRVGTFSSRDAFLEAGGNQDGRSAIYVAAGRSATDRYLDPISGGSGIHDDGSTESYFGKFDDIIGDAADLNIQAAYNSTRFSIPNSLQKVPPQDQRQNLDDYLLGARFNCEPGENSSLTLVAYRRGSRARITSGGLSQLASPADYSKAISENEKFFIGGDRNYTTTGGQAEYSLTGQGTWGSHVFRAGTAAEVFPVHEFFTFAVTNRAVSSPDSSGGDGRYLPYDITQGGSPFLVNQSKEGTRWSAYAEDEFHSGRWLVNAGIRYDIFQFIRHDAALSPRINVVYSFNDDLALRASYDRIVMQAPIENTLVSGSDEARRLTGADQAGIPTEVKNERSHNVEIGGTYHLNEFLDVDLTAYGKLIDDFIVKVELGNSGVIFPANLKRGYVAGGELKVRLRNWNGFSGLLAVTPLVSRGQTPGDGSSPVSGGLILGEEGANYSKPFGGESSFPTEHNQLLTIAANVGYEHPSGFFGLIAGRFDSGLPFDLTGPHGEALDANQSRTELLRRGYSDAVINLLDLQPETPGSPDRSVSPHATFDASAGYDFAKTLSIPVRLTLTILNVLDTPYLYKFESSFGGTHFGVPRTVALQLDVKYP